MLLHIPEVLDQETVLRFRQQLASADWVDGRVTAGKQAGQTKNNLQLAEASPLAKALRSEILDAMGHGPAGALFFSAALPRRIYPPLFNCYSGETNSFGNHVDNAVRTHAASGTHTRTDLSFTLFLCEPDDYEGGELVIEDGFNAPRIKLPAGDMILYPSSSVHRVEPVTRGARICCFSWLESMVRENERRELLFELDSALLELRQASDPETGDSPAVVKLTSTYHNLLRMWAHP